MDKLCPKRLLTVFCHVTEILGILRDVPAGAQTALPVP